MQVQGDLFESSPIIDCDKLIWVFLQTINEFNRLTDFDLLHVLKELIIDYADSIVRIKCTADKGILDGSDVFRTIFIPVYWYGHPNSGAQKIKYTFIYTIILHRRLFLPFKPQ